MLLIGCGKKANYEAPNTAAPTNDALSIYIDIKDSNRFYTLDDFGETNYLHSENKLVITDPSYQLIDGKYKISYILITNTLPIVNQDSMRYLSHYRHIVGTLFYLLKRTKPQKSYTSIIGDNFYGEIKNYEMTSLILNGTTPDVEIAEKEIQEMTNELLHGKTTSRYRPTVQKFIAVKAVLVKDEELLNSKLEKKTFQEVGKKQLTYIDFWASWCLPCRAEMPNSLLLSKEYETKGIRFIYISIDKNPIAWEKAVKHLGLKDQNS